MPVEIRAVIADDEPLARLRLRHLCAGAGDISVVAEAADGDEALAKVGELEPELLFLDMQMPGRHGLSVGELLDRTRRPLLVYVTAYAEYAVAAFAVDAVDYLLKPFDKDRFALTLLRVRERLCASRESKDALASSEPSAADRSLATRLAVRSGWRTRFIDISDVDYVAAEGNYVAVHVGAQSFLLRETLSSMEKRLEAAGFVRVHRSSLVRIDRIDEIEPVASGDYVLRLRGGKTVAATRSYRHRLLSALGLQR